MVKRIFVFLIVLSTILAITPSVLADETTDDAVSISSVDTCPSDEIFASSEDTLLAGELSLADDEVYVTDDSQNYDVIPSENTPDKALDSTNTDSGLFLEDLILSTDVDTYENAEKPERKEVTNALLDGWVKDGNYWCYYNNGVLYRNGIYIIEGDYYAFDSAGHMVTGWYKQVTGDYEVLWYYFDSDGKGHNGWLKQGNYWYYCKDGWAYSGTIFVIDGVRYAFNDDCQMQTGWYKYRFINGDYQWCYFDANGKGHNGWIKDSKYWYYCENGWTITNTICQINDAYYAFDEEGHMITGWYKPSYESDSHWYYFDSNGKGHNGWIKDSKNWYFCDEGSTFRNGIRTISGSTYAFDNEGRMVTGWYKQVTGDYEVLWYYFDSNGKGHDGWLKQGNYWYYCKDGWAYSGTIFVIDGVRYAFNDDCQMQTGWYKYHFINGDYQWCYFDANGKGHNGWIKDSKYWYYCENGWTITNTIYYVDDTCYAFDEEGRMATGWYKLVEGENTSWYYFDSDGKGHTGLAKDSKHTYYCSNGEIVTNQDVTVDGVTYHCDENGYAIPI